MSITSLICVFIQLRSARCWGSEATCGDQIFFLITLRSTERCCSRGDECADKQGKSTKQCGRGSRFTCGIRSFLGRDLGVVDTLQDCVYTRLGIVSRQSGAGGNNSGKVILVFVGDLSLDGAVQQYAGDLGGSGGIITRGALLVFAGTQQGVGKIGNRKISIRRRRRRGSDSRCCCRTNGPRAGGGKRGQRQGNETRHKQSSQRPFEPTLGHREIAIAVNLVWYSNAGR